MKIESSVALVTGANRGLGLAFAQALRDAGARKVYAAAREPSTVKLPGVTPLALDVTRPDQVARAAEIAADVTLVVNNAGALQASPLTGPDGEAATRSMLEVNLFGPLAVARAFAPVLKANGGGALVNMLSVLSWVALPGTGPYSISKAAAWALTNALRQELRAQGTQVVGIHAGYLDTDMARDAQGPKLAPVELVRQTLQVLAAGGEEVLGDAISRQVKAGLSAEPGAYLR